MDGKDSVTSLLDIIRADNKRYREALDLFLAINNITVDGPPKGVPDEGSDRTEPTGRPGTPPLADP
jgi:hypothetical protein